MIMYAYFNYALAWFHTHEHALHTQDYSPPAFHNPPMTPLTQNIVGKMAQDVGMVESIAVSSPSSLVGF